MTEQELIWNILKSEPITLCHTMAHHLQIISNKDEFHSQVDEYIHQLLNIFHDPETLSRIVKTWLVDYQLPIEPHKLESFDRWHDICKNYIVDHSANLESYGAI